MFKKILKKIFPNKVILLQGIFNPKLIKNPLPSCFVINLDFIITLYNINALFFCFLFL